MRANSDSKRESFEAMADIAATAVTRLFRQIRSAPTDALHRPLHQSLHDAAAPHVSQQHAGTAGLRKISLGRKRRLQQSIKPKGPGNNDRSRTERLINVLTSLPFVVVGLRTQQACTTPEGKRYGSTLIAVGAAATAYHASAGSVRPHLRKLDYYTISVASMQLLRALFPQPCRRRRALHAAGTALMPFQPTAVSMLNFGLAEVEFARTALRNRTLRRVYGRHAAVGGLGLVCFALEDVAISLGFYFVHSMWHLQACYAVASANALMQQREQEGCTVRDSRSNKHLVQSAALV